LYEFLYSLIARSTRYQVFTTAHRLRFYVRRLRERPQKEIAVTIKDLITKQTTTCRPETNLASASALMWENDCGALAALTETGELAGVITDRDICIALGTRNARASELTVRDLVGLPLLVCKSTDDIRSALQTMREARIRRLPVVDENGVLEGIVSIDDIVLSVQRGDGKAGATISYRDVATALQEISSHRVAA
jgi:CBS domain-containing protein